MPFSLSQQRRAGVPAPPSARVDSGDGLNCEQVQQLSLSTSPSRPLLIDTRPLRQYRRSHVKGSHHIPAARLISSEPPEGDLILISETTAQAKLLIDGLQSTGYTRRIRYLQEGFPSWCQHQLPCETEFEPRDERGPGWRGVPLAGLLALSGVPLILTGALGASLPLLALGLLLIVSPWIEAGLGERSPSRHLELDG